MNVVNLIGKVVRVKIVSGSVTKFKLATPTGYDRKNKKDRKVFVPVTAFGLSEEQRHCLRSGNLVALEGIVAETSYKKNGIMVFQTTVQISRSGLKLV